LHAKAEPEGGVRENFGQRRHGLSLSQKRSLFHARL
jgi:hypothetical protein